MIYDLGTGSDKDWIVAEDEIDWEHTHKCESILCLGNGYMGIRSSFEEPYVQNRRYALVAGTYDKSNETPTELPNFADVTGMRIKVNGYDLDLTTGKCSKYLRTLNLKTGLLKRQFVWTTPAGDDVKFTFERFISLADKHLLAAKVAVQPLTGDAKIQIETGIDGRDRYGLNHFIQMDACAEEEFMQYCEITNQRRIPFIITTQSLISPKNAAKTELTQQEQYIAKRYTLFVQKNNTVLLEKITNVYTMRDRECEHLPLEKVRMNAIEQLKKACDLGFDELHKASAMAWQRVWDEKDVLIETKNSFDQLALRFAVYHITIMAPVHDNRMSIGAKGLSGKGYRGHVFWDTEIYLLPYFIYTDPAGARSLLEYRYHNLYGARLKAAENGYEGAMYPWESGWITDGEVTPPTAKFGLQEHHITADIAYGVYHYFSVTDDHDFMKKYGYEIVFETAKFWQSRLNYNSALDRYEILGVIGPDEFTHDANNNAFTNYMAHFNMKLAMRYYQTLKESNSDVFDRLNRLLQLDSLYQKLDQKADKLYLPRENEQLLVPQDDTFLSLPEIDLTPYRLGLKKLRDDYKGYSYSKLQVSKQADVAVLLLLLEDLFSQEVKAANFRYYEARCVHESSLSLCTYSILAADVHNQQSAYDLYQKACRIDLGPNMNSSKDGIHAASLGGIWQCTVLGFLGVRLYNGQLRIQPNLPKMWESVKAKIYWKGQPLLIEANHEDLRVTNVNGQHPVSFICNNQTIIIEDTIIIPYGVGR